MKKRQYGFVTLAALIAVALFSCAEKKDENKIVTVSVPQSVSSIPLLALDGVDIDGYRIKASIFQDHSLTLAEFIRGNIDVIATGYTQGISAHEGNKNMVCLATFVWGVSSLVVRDKTIARLADLAGKSVIVPFPKSPLDLQLRAILSSKNLLDKVTIEYGPTQQAIPLLLAGKADAIAVPEPFASDLELKGSGRRLFTFQKAWAEITNGEERSPQVSLFATKGFVEKHTGFVRSFLARVGSAIAGLSEEPDKKASEYASIFHVDKSVIGKGLENTLFDLPSYRTSLSLSSDYLARIGLKQPEPGFYFEY